MYYATKRNNAQTRVIGLVGVVVALGGTGYALANGLGIIETKEKVETEVVMIEEEIEVEDEPPPPPPVDVDLPPPPPQVILPDFVFETPPPQESAIQKVVSTPTPSPPPPPRVTPPPPPAVTLARKPQPGRRFEKPEYPAAAKRAGESGEVGVSMCVAADGKISDVKIIKSSGFPRLDEATLKGLPRTRMDPAVGSDGKPMAMCNPPYTMTLVWDLKEERR